MYEQKTIRQKNDSSFFYSHGALLQSDGATRFALWAPDADKVEVSLGDGRLFELQALDEGWFELILDCPAGTSYRYIINGKFKVPDPAARLQFGDADGMSCVVDHHYNWKNSDWRGLPWHHSIIYELHVGVIGSFSKVEKFLPKLARLGITAIELMPINEFPGTRNWGYDGVLPFAPEASYGSPDELKSLIDTAHGLGMMVFLDVVYNHFGPDGNYLGQYASPFFREEIHTPWGAAINFRQRQVRDFFCENAVMWINDYRFDGLRLDAVHAIGEKDFLIELAERVRATVAPDRYVHLILENEDNTASLLQKGFDAQWNDDGHNVLHHILTGEDEGYYADFVKSPTEKLARCLKEGFIYQGEKTSSGHSRGEPSAHLSPTAFVLFLQNHDQIGNRALGERLTRLTDSDALKAALVLVTLSPMIPLLFMGEELGSKCPFLYFTDHKDELAKAVCEGRRNEFASFTKFSGAESREQIPDPNAITTFLNSRVEFLDEVETSYVASDAVISEHQQWWNFYKELLTLRHKEIIPHLNECRSSQVIILAESAIYAEWILGNNTKLGIYLNLSRSSIDVSLDWTDKKIIFKHLLTEADYQNSVLPAFGAVVILN